MNQMAIQIFHRIMNLTHIVGAITTIIAEKPSIAIISNNNNTKYENLKVVEDKSNKHTEEKNQMTELL